MGAPIYERELNNESNEKAFAASQIITRVQFIKLILSSAFSREKVALFYYLHLFLTCCVEVHYLLEISSLEVTSCVFFELNLTILKLNRFRFSKIKRLDDSY